jgi:hypothetical protein
LERVLRLACVVLLLSGLLLVSGCSSDDDGGTPSQSDSADEAALRLLDGWSDDLTSALVLLRDQSEAYRAGRPRRGARLERRARRLLEPVQHYGRDARKAMLDYHAAIARKVVAAGDGWSEWAYTLLTDPPRGNFDKARHVADLGVVAIERHQAAYRAAGHEPPSAFRTR